MPEINRRQFLAGSAAASMLRGTPQAQVPPRRLLSGGRSVGEIDRVLLARDVWRPFAAADDRAAWESVPDAARTPAMQAAERSMSEGWPSLPASVFLDFKRNGNRSNYEHIQFARRDRLQRLVIGECLEDKGRFLDQILDGIWLTCEESFWGVPAHLGAQKAGTGLPDVTEPIVDLFAAETSSLLAWVDYLLAPQLEKLSPRLRPRIAFEVNRRILTPCLERDDFGWMGLGSNAGKPVNNWNPWINSNWLASALLLESDRARRTQAVYKILTSLDSFLDGYHDDGGCDEGPSYWGRAGASLFDNLELLDSATRGRLSFFGLPLVGEIGRYIYRVHIARDYFVNFADAPAKVSIDGDLVFRYGKRIGDEEMQALGGFAAAGRVPGEGSSMMRQLAALFDVRALQAAPKAAPLGRDAWFPGIQVMTARVKPGSTEGLYLAAQGGHNAESHNHNDVGNLIVYANGDPVLIDVGVETYSAKTFSAHRYDIWTMQSAYHNLPTIDGVMQGAGRQFAARDAEYKTSDAAAALSLNIEQAYPPEAHLREWRRTVQLDRQTPHVEILDRYKLAQPARKIEFSLMTPCRVSPAAAGEITLSGGLLRSGSVRVLYNTVLQPRIDEIPIADANLLRVWGSKLYRIRLVAAEPPLEGSYLVRVIQSS